MFIISKWAIFHSYLEKPKDIGNIEKPTNLMEVYSWENHRTKMDIMWITQDIWSNKKTRKRNPSLF